MREPGGVGHAVVVVPDRVDAAAVGVAGAGQHVEGPQAAGADGKARRAVAAHRHAAGLFEHLPGAPDVTGEGFGAELAGALVAVAVAGQFMAAGHDAAHQRGVALGDPAQGEEGGFRAVLVEQGQDAVDVALDAAFPALPPLARDPGREGRDLEVVLHVDGQGVQGRGGRGQRSHGGRAQGCWGPAGGSSRGTAGLGPAAAAAVSFCSSVSTCTLMRSRRSRLRSSRCS